MEKTASPPSGFVLIPDKKLAGYTPPPGFRVERAPAPRRARGGISWLRDLKVFMAEMDEVEHRGCLGWGILLPYSKAGRIPRLLAERIGGESPQKWAFAGYAGGLVRIFPFESDPKRMLDWFPGEWAEDSSKAPVPGYAKVTDCLGTPLRVRLPEKPRVVPDPSEEQLKAWAMALWGLKEDAIERALRPVEGALNRRATLVNIVNGKLPGAVGR